MSNKSLIQIVIFSIIIFILAFVYYKYFNTNKNIVEEINSLEINNQEQLQVLEKKILELETKNNELILEINNDKKIDIISSEIEEKEVKEVDNIIIKKNTTNLETKKKKYSFLR